MDDKVVISDVFKLGYNVHSYEGLLDNKAIPLPDQLLGIELELEGWHYDEPVPNSFTTEGDGSLKDNGVEFVSQPIAHKYLGTELKLLKKAVETCKTSPRCSLHIHLDVRNITWIALRNFIVLYSVFEKTLFRLSGNRWDNLYCVPLYANPDGFLELFRSRGYARKPKWYKYSALNLCTIWGDEDQHSAKLGTVEIRIHEGTTDVNAISKWCAILCHLMEYSKHVSPDILLDLLKTMNTTSTYNNLARDIFGDYSYEIIGHPRFKEEVESCITRTKYALLNTKGVLREFGFLHKPKPAPKTKLRPEVTWPEGTQINADNFNELWTALHTQE